MTTDSQFPMKRPNKGRLINELLHAFEAAAHSDGDGVQYWLARQLAPLLGYRRWENFHSAIDRAIMACTNSGEVVDDHFRGVTNMVPLGSGAERQVDDVELTRFACYLIALNGDPTKSEIAAAQTYFAVQTRRQEIADLAAREPPQLTEDEKRVLLRNEVKEHNKTLASAAKEAGVVQPLDYAIFQNEGYKGLYGGLDRKGIQRRKRLKARDDILDHMPSGELAANLFRATQTEEKLRREAIKGKATANKTHFDVGRKVRQTINEIGGTMPEEYRAVEHVKEARKRLGAGRKPRMLEGQ